MPHGLSPPVLSLLLAWAKRKSLSLLSREGEMEGGGWFEEEVAWDVE